MKQMTALILAALLLAAGCAAAEQGFYVTAAPLVCGSRSDVFGSSYGRALVTEAILLDWCSPTGGNAGRGALSSERSLCGLNSDEICVALRDGGGLYMLFRWPVGSDVAYCSAQGLSESEAQARLESWGCSVRRNAQTDLYRAAAEVQAMFGGY